MVSRTLGVQRRLPEGMGVSNNIEAAIITIFCVQGTVDKAPSYTLSQSKKHRSF